MARKNIPISIIVTPNVFFKVKNGYSAEVEEFIKYEHTSFYVCDNAKISFGVTDRFFSLSLFFQNGTFDPRSDLVGFTHLQLNGEKTFLSIIKKNQLRLRVCKINNFLLITHPVELIPVAIFKIAGGISLVACSGVR